MTTFNLGSSNTLDDQAVIVVKFKLNKKVPDAALKIRQCKAHSNVINVMNAEPAVLRAEFDEDLNDGQILIEVSLSEDTMISMSVYDKVPW